MTSPLIHSLVLGGLLLMAPLTTQTGSASGSHKAKAQSALVECTPIVMDHVVLIVCDNEMDHIWIYTGGGSLWAEREGSLGYQQEFDLSGAASGFYTVVVSTEAGGDTERFFYGG